MAAKKCIDATTDRECQEFLRDLRQLESRARSLRERFDREHVAVGKCWGIANGLAEALHSANRELAAKCDLCGEPLLPGETVHLKCAREEEFLADQL